MRQRKLNILLGRLSEMLIAVLLMASPIAAIAATDSVSIQPLPPNYSYLQGQLTNSCDGSSITAGEVVSDDREQVKSDSSGSYRIGLVNGTHFVIAQADGYFYAIKQQTIRDGSNYLDFQLEPLAGCPIKSAQNYQVILLAGGGKILNGKTNPVWEASTYLADRAYQALRLQGLAAADIRYFSAEAPRDIDGDGKTDTENLTLNNLAQALTGWAGKSEQTLLYAVAPGSTETLQLNALESLTAKQLGIWTDQLLSVSSTKFTVVVEANQSGSFLTLGKARKTIIASTLPQHATVLGSPGSNSFSYYFWTQIGINAQVETAFRSARQAMSSQRVTATQVQNAQLDADGDQLFSPSDLESLKGMCVGRCNRLASIPLVVDSVNVDSRAIQQGRLTLSAQISGLDAIKNAWFTLTPPDFQPTDIQIPISERTRYPLTCTPNGACSANFDQLQSQGDYLLNVYAESDAGLISLPRAINLTRRNDDFFDAVNNKLYLRAVNVGTETLQVTLRHLGDYRFSVESTTAQTDTRRENNSELSADNQLIVPRVFAFGRYYRVVFSNQGSRAKPLFQLVSQTELQP